MVFGVMNMNIKQLTLIALLSAATLALNIALPWIYLIFFILLILSLRVRESIILGFIVGLLTFIISGKVLTLTNIFWLPMIVVFFKPNEVFIYGNKLSEGCLSRPMKHIALRLFLISLVSISIANIGSEVVSMWLFDSGWMYVFGSLPIALGGALINAIIIGFIGLPVQQRFSKLLYQLNET
jgi:hypothetical protein